MRPVPASTALPGGDGRRLESRSLDSPGLKGFLETNLNRELPAWPMAKWDFEMLTLAAFYYQPEPGRCPRRLGGGRGRAL